MTVTPPNGDAMRRTGYMLTILRKESDGRWRITRDADLLATEKSAN
jgi:ketosteroid isomerase-like protein